MRIRLRNILEEMSNKDQQQLKKNLFVLWNNSGPTLDFDTLKYVGVNKPYTVSEISSIYKFFRQYIGGNKEAVKRFKDLVGKTFTTKKGGYDFKFKIKDYSLVEDELIDNHIFATNLQIELIPGGTVFVSNGERYLLDDLINLNLGDLNVKYGDVDSDIVYEIVNYELQDVITETLNNEITVKTGIEIDGINEVF
jgi:hypothetical protein